MTALEAKKTLQALLLVSQDGKIGPKTLQALNALVQTPDEVLWGAQAQEPASEVHSVKASSFADPADIRSFRRCKANGGTDQECFRVGDNGIGKWGDDCSEDSGPSCALPPEDWQQFGAAAHRKPVKIIGNGREVVALLKDTMPHKANITNGCGIDLNPDTVRALGWEPPLMEHVTWQWA